MPIKRLPAEVASKIAAGEVVERPASVVKELVENAIDAGATEIRVEVKKGGKRLIRVADNGAGIPGDEVALAFEHHATSKLEVAEDLFALHTLGFRGEALPSIAAVSQVTVLSRTRDESVGTQLRIEGGKQVAKESRGAPAGTILSVEHLFYNIPVRRKFLRTNATENGAISAIVSTYALAYPDRRFSLHLDGRQSFQSSGSGELKDAIMAVYGLKVVKGMLPMERLEDEESGVAVDGYIGAPALHRPNRKYITLFVNGRAVKSKLLMTSVLQAYQGVAPTGRFPVVVLRVEVPPDEIDVNIHPQKQEVKFARGDEVFSVVQRAIRRSLIDDSPVHSYTRAAEPVGMPDTPPALTPQPPPRLEGEHPSPPPPPPDDWLPFDRPAEAAPAEPAPPPPPPFPYEEIGPTPSMAPAPRGKRRDSSFWTQAATPPQEVESSSPTIPIPPATIPIPPAASPAKASQPAPEPESAQIAMEIPTQSKKAVGYQDEHGSSRLPPLRVLGQIHKTFIICEGPDGLYLIDQHTAHERVLLERFQRARAKRMVPSQRLLTPLTLELTPQQMALVEEQQESLLHLGFEIEPFGGLLVIVRALPTLLQHHPDPAGALAEIMDGTISDRSGLSWEERLVMYAACRGAVKAGDTLNVDEMRDLIRQLEETNLSRTCAHGRPTVVRLSHVQLEREFGRR